MKNRVFFPQSALDEWLADESIDLSADELTIKTEGRRYKIVEAARILAEVTGAEDGFELIGRVKSLAFLNELGAELLETSMILGDNAYDVVPGFVGAPVGSFKEHRQSVPDIPDELRSLVSDEELLASFLSAKL